jgi:uncharacterized protein (TIGR03437 family)
LVRLEGITERTGDVLFSCSGGQPGAQITGNLTLFLSVNVSNKTAADGTADVLLTINGAPANVPPRVTSINAITFNGLTFTLTPQGTVEIRLQNVRANASQLLATPDRVITLYATFTGGALLSFTANNFGVGVPQRALYATSTGRLICTQAGSPLPAALTVTSLAAASAFTTTRVTEGFATAFAPKSDWSSQNADTGTRIIQRYSGFTPASRLFVPDFIAGSDADEPTAAGDLGSPAAGGAYTPGKGQLLLARVTGADSSGAGGSVLSPAPAAATNFTAVSELPLVNGAAYVVYEVMDASPLVQESAQIPTFLGLPAGGPTAETDSSVNLAPASTLITAAAAPVPRFLNVPPLEDCTLINDCGASYFPRLKVDTTSLQLMAPGSATGYIPVRNDAGGLLRWSASTSAAFLTLAPAQGVNNGTIRVDASAGNLPPGIYNATILIDAGPIAGTRSVAVTFTVGTPVAMPPSLRAVTSAASASVFSLVPGSLATIYGSRFMGRTVLATFDGTPAQILFANDTQINLLVPAALAGKSAAELRISIDGNPAAPKTVPIAVSAPAIFAGAVLNQDWSPNTASSSAAPGTILQIFATGLPASGPITARVHDRDIPAPAFAGQAPGLPGVQQINVAIPADLPAMQTYVYVCGAGVCSPAEKLWLGPT